MTSFAAILGPELIDTDGNTVATAEKLKDQVTAVYFSAHWVRAARADPSRALSLASTSFKLD